MKEIVVTIKNKIATAKETDFIVNGNSDITARFIFDRQWDNAGIKTAVFVLSDGSAHYKVLKDDQCAVPVIYNTSYVKIGVISDGIFTSTPATIECRACITDEVVAKATENDDLYTELCAYIAERMPETEAPGQVFITDNYGKPTWTSVTTVFDGYTKQETEELLNNRAYKRRLNTVAAEITELTDIDDYRLENVSNIKFVCGSISESNLILSTAQTGELSIVFEGVKAYSGDNVSLLGNEETWEFNLKNGCLNGKRWGYINH